jgi:hypothetical protein
MLLPDVNEISSVPRRDIDVELSCANDNYGLEVNLINAVRRYLRNIGSWPKL